MAGVQQGQNNGSRGSMTITVSDLYIELGIHGVCTNDTSICDELIQGTLINLLIFHDEFKS
jgi:hypothetical protein